VIAVVTRILRLTLVLAFLPALVGCAKPDRLDTSLVPGVVIAHSPASSGVYLGSPALAVLPGGEYVVSLDFFGPATQMNTNCIYRSSDRGKSWSKLTEIRGQFWSSLFVHNGALYLLGTSERYGTIVIRRSTDGGATWTTPVDHASGLLRSDSMYHCAPVPVVEHNGWLWRAFERQTGTWPSGFEALVLSAPVGAELLASESWTSSASLSWGGWDPYKGWLEGNIVVTPEGELVDVLRVHEPVRGGVAAVAHLSRDGRRLSFDAEEGFIAFPGGCKKFTIRWDTLSGRYWSLTNWVHPADVGGNVERTRNTLALISSTDVKTWTLRSVVLRLPDPVLTGFQYVDWLVEGEDLIAVSRTACEDGLGGAHNSHDANFITFHRIRGFRTLENVTGGP